MKTLFLSILFLLLFDTTGVKAQGDSLKLKIVKGEYVYTYHGNILSEKQLQVRLKTNSQAWRTFRSRRSEDIFAEIIGYPGIALLGYSLATLIIKEKVNPLLLSSGIVCIGLSLPFVMNKKARIRLAVEVYNEALSP